MGVCQPSPESRWAACSRRSSGWPDTVEGLLAISRLDAGEAQAEWLECDLAELAATTADHMALLAEDKGIAIAAKRGAGAGAGRSRAPQAGGGEPAGQRHQVHPRRWCGEAAGDRPEWPRARLEVADTGIGIPPEACRMSLTASSASIRRDRTGDPAGQAWGSPSSNPSAPPTAPRSGRERCRPGQPFPGGLAAGRGPQGQSYAQP